MPDRSLLERLDFKPEPFRCHPLFMNQHAQTIWGTLQPRGYGDIAPWRSAGRERLFDLADGDRLKGVLHLHPDDAAKKRPLLVLLHGLEGDVDSHYVWGLSTKAFRLGYSSLRLNFRNCGGTEHLARRIYTGMMSEDVREVMQALAAEGHRAIIPMGVSLGANLLLRLLATYGEAPPEWLWGAVAVSPPIEMTLVSEAFGRGFNRLYDTYFLLQLREKMRRKARAFPDEPKFSHFVHLAQQADSLRAFDDAITAPESGFRDAIDYYTRASSGDRLGEIRVPTLIVHAQDDPFIPFEMFRRREALIRGNPYLTPVFPQHGGHVGFFESKFPPRSEPWMDEYWAENQALRYAGAVARAHEASPVGVSPQGAG